MLKTVKTVQEFSGQLVKDLQEGIEKIEWTVTGKVKKITFTTSAKSSGKKDMKFVYGPMDRRVAKVVYNNDAHSDITYTYYTYDAMGNVLATYERLQNLSSDAYTLEDFHVYGASRLGTAIQGKRLAIRDLTFVGTSSDVETATDMQWSSPTYNTYDKTFRLVGQKYYELSNHLGNVLAVITDKKIPLTTTTYTADVVRYSDYSPYGVQLDNRHGGTGYRYGFQGQEMDDEIKGEGNSLNYEYRMHDPRIGRFFAIDPLAAKYPDWSPYTFSGNQVIHTFELEGLEPNKELMTKGNIGKSFMASSQASGQEGRVYNYVLRSDETGSDLWWEQGEIVTGPTPDEARQINNHVYNMLNENFQEGGKNSKVGSTKWEVVNHYIGENGYKAALYRKEVDGIYFYTLAFAGTDDFSDGLEDVRAVANMSSYQFKRAKREALRITNYLMTNYKHGNSLTFTGHSLGGALASIAALATGGNAITFNALGLSSKAKDNLGINGKIAKIDAFVVKGEAVDVYQRKLGLKAEGIIHYVESSEKYYSFETYLKSLGLSMNQVLAIPDLLKTMNEGYLESLFMQRINSHDLKSFKGKL